MNLDDITPLVLTFNESANIERTLSGLIWARRIVVVDSGSSDTTVELAEHFDNAFVIKRSFDNHTSQWNFGLSQVDTPWVLTLDADYVCQPCLADELRSLSPEHDAYEADFRYCIGGRPLRGSLYPPRVALFRTDRFRYRQDGHTQLLAVDVPLGKLQCKILHDDRKPPSHWLAAQSKYADLEVLKLTTTPRAQLAWKDRLRKQIIWAAPLTLPYCLFIRRLILDGWPGIYYSLQRTYAELLLSLKLLEARLSGREVSVADRHQRDGSTSGNAGLEATQAPTREPDQIQETIV